MLKLVMDAAWNLTPTHFGEQWGFFFSARSSSFLILIKTAEGHLPRSNVSQRASRTIESICILSLQQTFVYLECLV